jgi:GNAT superfamily N-acetyltransferase
MDAEIRMNEGCSLRVGIPTAYPKSIQACCRELTEFYTLPAKRGQGFAKKLLEAICKEADEAGFALLLHVEPYDDCTMDEKRLESLYSRNGFVVFQQKPKLMCRTAKVSEH